MTLTGVKTVTLRYFTEYGKLCVPTHKRVDLWTNMHESWRVNCIL